MGTADLGVPILFLILFFWAFLALAGILTTVGMKTRLGDKLRKLRSRYHIFTDKRHGQ